VKLATEDTWLDRGPGRGDDAGPTTAVLTFVVSGETYGLAITSLREIIKQREITEVPRMPAFLLGIISVRGTIVPVIDLRVRLGFEAMPATRVARILVVQHRGDLLGMLVDAVTGVVRLSEASIEPTPATLTAAEGHMVAGIARSGQGRRAKMVVMLNLDTAAAFEFARRVR
jgi:purine-binding chemotaxis protein CheW